MKCDESSLDTLFEQMKTLREHEWGKNIAIATSMDMSDLKPYEGYFNIDNLRNLRDGNFLIEAFSVDTSTMSQKYTDVFVYRNDRDGHADGFYLMENDGIEHKIPDGSIIDFEPIGPIVGTSDMYGDQNEIFTSFLSFNTNPWA